MPLWFARGLRRGMVTTRYPARPDNSARVPADTARVPAAAADPRVGRPNRRGVPEHRAEQAR